MCDARAAVFLAICVWSISAECGFSSEFCRWQIQKPWEVQSEALITHSFLEVPPLVLRSDGEFLIAQGRFGSNSSGTAVSPLLEGFRGTRLLSFSYSKTGGSAILQVQLKEGLSYRTLDTIDSVSLKTWNERTTMVPQTDQIHQIVFRISGAYGGSNSFAIDNIRLRSVNSKIVSYDSGSDINILAGNAIDEREIRRAPSNEAVTSTCRAIKCQFMGNACLWNSTGFKKMDGKIVSENVEGILSSEPVLLPINSHLQISIFTSDSSLVSIYQKTGSEEVLLWSQGGVPLPGWNSFRIPIKYVALPSSFVIRSSSTSGSFLAISQTNLVDEKGRDLACGLNVPAIRPHREATVRLTALQIIDDEQTNNSLQPPPQMSFSRNPPMTSSPALIPPVPSMVIPNNQIPTPERSHHLPTPRGIGVASLPIAPAMISSPPDPLHSHNPVIRVASGSSIVPATSLDHHAPMIKTYSATEKPLVAQTSSTLTHLVSAAAGRSVSSEEIDVLKQLAKRFGINDLSSPNVGRLLAAGKHLQALGGLRLPLLTPPEQTTSSSNSPISPINKEKQSFLSGISKDHMSLLSRLPPSFNEVISSRLNKILENSSKDDSRHFARNVDYAVQRAFNDYIQQARP